MSGSVNPPVVAANTNPTLYTAVISPSSAALYRNGALCATVGNTRYPGPNGLCVGGSQCSASGGNEFSNGMVSEVIVYNRALSTAERIAVETYLRTKYSLVSW